MSRRPDHEFEGVIEDFRTYCCEKTGNENWVALISNRENFHYFTGLYNPLMLLSDSRPWYLLISNTEFIPVIPEIGADPYRNTSYQPDYMNFYTWPSPTPEDEGISLLTNVIQKHFPNCTTFLPELGAETRSGFPAGDLLKLLDNLKQNGITKVDDCVPMVRKCRNIKTPWEIENITTVCNMVNRAFDNLPRIIETLNKNQNSVNMKDVVREFKIECFRQGVHEVVYIAAGCGQSGYVSVIDVDDKILEEGDVLVIDTGCKYNGYFCDYDRNLVLGKHDPIVDKMYDAMWEATEAGLQAIKPGNIAQDIWIAQAKVFREHGFEPDESFRYGHGLGKSLTEPPSNKMGDLTPIYENMVFTVEPAVVHNGLMQCHEENCVVTKNGSRMLHPRAPRHIPVVNWITKPKIQSRL